MKTRPVANYVAWLTIASLCISFTCFAAEETPASAPAKARPGSSKATRDRAGKREARPSKPAPTFGNVSYGPDVSNKIDFWKANSAAPTPLVVFIHGGGFRGGDKAAYDGSLLTACLAS